ncbi:MAG: P1 family peptidase, partial [Candidatus Acidiferrales bacterium]
WEAAAALVDFTLALPGNEDVGSVNPVVGETNDGGLNNIRRRPLRKEHFLAALRAAKDGPVEEGSVGAGTGTGAFGFKGGIGTASRRLPDVAGGYTVGVLVQPNYGGDLTMDGVPVGRELSRKVSRLSTEAAPGSCMIVVATDAPLDSRQLRRLAWRAFAGMARTGASFSNGSGDYAIAFSVAAAVRIRLRSQAEQLSDPLWLLSVTLLADPENSPLFQAVAEATEEAIYNSLLRATTVRGFQGREAHELDIPRLEEILKKFGRAR